MQVIIEYHGKWLEWCVCTAQGEILLDSFETYADAHNWAANSGWEVV